MVDKPEACYEEIHIEIASEDEIEVEIAEIEHAEPLHFVITGTIVSAEGFLHEDGSVPWYMDWFRLEIEKDDGSPAIIIGVHQTAYIFSSAPSPGMSVKAYIPKDSPVFISDPPLYVASVIVAELPAELNVEIGRFMQTGTSLVRADGYRSVAFRTSDETIIEYADLETGKWSQFQTGNRGGQIMAVVYKAASDDTPTAAHITVLYDDLPISQWEILSWLDFYDEDPPDYIALAIADYIFAASDFHTLNLPIFINGTEFQMPPPILWTDGATIMVPFRPIFMPGGQFAGIGFGNYAELTFYGELRFGGGGGGSENSHWRVGRTWTRGVGWGHPLDAPPVIVDGIIYIPLSAFGRNAPFTNFWLFDDRIEIFGTSQYPYGPWLGPYPPWPEYLMTPEEAASLHIVVNGTRINAPPPLYESRSLMVPLKPVAQAMGYTVQRLNIMDTTGRYIRQGADGYFLLDASQEIMHSFYHYTLYNDEVYVWLRSFNAIVYNGEILIDGFWGE